MSNFLIIVFCLFAGYFLKKAKLVKPDGYRTVNTWIIYIGLPAVSFCYVPGLVWDNDLLLLILSPLFILPAAVAFVSLLKRPLGLSRRSASTLMLVSGFANTSFVGFPLVAAYFGEDKISWAIISDQVTFFLLAAVGSVIAIRGASSAKVALSSGYIARRVCTFPPLWGFLAALLLPKVFDMAAFKPFFQQLASTVSPLALFSVGMQLSFTFYRSELFAISLSLLYKLVIGPFLLLFICYALGLKGALAQVAVFEMAMPSLVATSLLLEQFKLNSKLGNSVIGFSILIGLLSTWITYQCIIYLL